MSPTFSFCRSKSMDIVYLQKEVVGSRTFLAVESIHFAVCFSKKSHKPISEILDKDTGMIINLATVDKWLDLFSKIIKNKKIKNNLQLIKLAQLFFQKKIDSYNLKKNKTELIQLTEVSIQNADLVSKEFWMADDLTRVHREISLSGAILVQDLNLIKRAKDFETVKNIAHKYLNIEKHQLNFSEIKKSIAGSKYRKVKMVCTFYSDIKTYPRLSLNFTWSQLYQLQVGDQIFQK